jgi:hypothetical protein
MLERGSKLKARNQLVVEAANRLKVLVQSRLSNRLMISLRLKTQLHK